MIHIRQNHNLAEKAGKRYLCLKFLFILPKVLIPFHCQAMLLLGRKHVLNLVIFFIILALSLILYPLRMSLYGFITKVNFPSVIPGFGMPEVSRMDNDKILNEGRDYFDRVVLPDFKKQTAATPKILRDMVYKTSREAFASGWLACFSEKISADMTDSEADNGTV